MVKSDTAEDKFLEQHKQFILRDTVTYPNGGCSKFYDDGECRFQRLMHLLHI